MRAYGGWALVAGASEGLGAAFARALAARGHPMLLIARRQAELEALAASLKVETATLALDLGAPDLEERVRAFIGARDVGVLVCNAAFAPQGPLVDRPLADAVKAIDVNCRSPVTLTHVVLPGMVARKRGAVVLMSSLTAFQGSPYVAVYGATKAFNLTLAEALWAEVAVHGVDVVASCAGATRTPGYLESAIGKAPGELEPEQVVAETLGALGRGPSVVPGAFNRFASFLMRRLMPRSRAIALIGAQTKKLLKS